MASDDSTLIDLRHLAVFDNSPLDLQQIKKRPEEYLTLKAQETVQKLADMLWQQPSEMVADVGKVFTLPDAVTRLPREKSVPEEEKQLSKWETFAKEKGISKKKRERMVFDDDADQFRPRFGYNSKANQSIQDDWLVPDGPSISKEDPFTKRKEKKENITKNEKAKARNLKMKERNIEKKDALKKVYSKVAVSNASLGKFGKRPAEEASLKLPKAKRVKKDSVTVSLASERTKQARILAGVLGGKSVGSVNVDFKKARK
eukprot:ANDGO_05427.mRNA.1 Ribosome biogenesis regulatory protein homolog